MSDETREKPDPGVRGTEGARPAEAAGDTPRDCRPRAAAGDWGGFGQETQGTASPEERSAFLEALARSTVTHLKLANLNLEGQVLAVEARLARLDETIAQLTDSRAARAGTEAGDAARSAVSTWLAAADPIRAHLATIRAGLAGIEAALAGTRKGTDHG